MNTLTFGIAISVTTFLILAPLAWADVRAELSHRPPEPRNLDDRLLAAIAKRESGTKEHPNGDPTRIGHEGERTIYQIKPSTWASYSNVPMAQATPAEAKRVAECHLHAIRLLLPHYGVSVNARNAVMAWKIGCRGVSDAIEHYGPVLAETRAYADEVINLMESDSK